MTKRKPLVSLGMIAYNHEPYIRSALDSLLAQHEENFELIISDDGSTDGTPDICREYQAKDNRIRFYRNKTNIGPVENYKRVFQLSSGKYFMWTDDHDLWSPDTLSTHLQVLTQSENTVLVYSPATYIDGEDNVIRVPGLDKPADCGLFSAFLNVISGGISSTAITGMIVSEAIQKTSMLSCFGNDTLFLAELSLAGRFSQLENSYYFRRENRPPESYQERMRRYTEVLLRNVQGIRKSMPLESMVYHYLCMIQNNNLSLADQRILNLGVLDTFTRGWGIQTANIAQFILAICQEPAELHQNCRLTSSDIARDFKAEKSILDVEVFTDTLVNTAYSELANTVRATPVIQPVGSKKKPQMPTKKFPSSAKYDVCYILYDTSKWGGVKGTLTQVNGLVERGYRVCLVAKSPLPSWFPVIGDFIQSLDLAPEDIPESDIIIGTWYPTVSIAFKAGQGICVHYCRGYEGQYPGLSASQKEQIRNIYELPAVKIANSAHIARFLEEKFEAETYTVRNDINHEIFYPQKKVAKLSQPYRILIVGPYEITWKGVQDCLEACNRLKREYRLDIEVIRASQTPQTDQEARLVSEAGYPYQYHHNLSEQEMAQLYNSCDLFLAGSYPLVESFGRPVMEALACGIPTVTTNIPAYTDYAPIHDYALWVEPGDIQAMAEAAFRLLFDIDLRERLITRGLEVSALYGVEQTLDDLEQAISDIYRKHSTHKPTIKPSQAPSYYQFSRPEVQALVPPTARRILDVGCAGGALGQGLKTRQKCEVTGIEYVPEVAEIARTVLDKVYAGDINQIAPTLPRNYFDAIIFADVLEHLPDPAAVLRALLPTLADGGRFVISIPNVRHWSVVKGLLEGRWDYEEAGLLDRTHLRFFTRDSFERLLNQVGLQPVSVGATSIRYEPIPSPLLGALKTAGLNITTLEHESRVYQWLYVAEVIPPLTTDNLGTTSIIILTHNGLEHTQRCLESIEAHTPEPHELIIVDNASTDDTLDYLRQYQATHPNVRVITNSTNLGFSAGNNQGLALAQGDFVLLLNNDTIVTHGWLGRLLTIFHRYPEVGMVGPMSNHVSGPQLVMNAAYQNLEGMTQFASTWAAKYARQSVEFFRLVGFCLLARREVIDRIGGLDERFGSGNFEDDDFCLRAAVAGFKARIVQDVFIHHTGGQTFQAVGIDYQQSIDRNWDIFKRKWNLPASLPNGGDYRPFFATPPTEEYITLPEPANLPLQQRSQTGKGLTLVLLADEAAQPEQLTTCLEHLEHYRPANQTMTVKMVNPPASLPTTTLKMEKVVEPSALTTLKTALTSSSKYVLLLAADVIVTEKWLDTLLVLAETDPMIAAIGPAANAAPAAQQVEGEYTNLTGLPAFAATLAGRYQAQCDEVLYLGGFCLLLKSHAVRVVGGLNESLPLPDALLDLYGRLKNFGFKRVCARGVYVHHHHLSAAEGGNYDALAAYHQQVNLALAAGQTALEQDDLETAVREFSRTAAQYPNLAPVHSALSTTLLALGQTAAALPPLRRAIELNPEDFKLRQQLGQMLYQVGQRAEAEDIFKQITQTLPTEVETRLILVHLYREQGRYAEAVKTMKEVLSLDSTSTDVVVASGLLMLDLNDLEAAELAWLQLKDVPPTHPGALILLSALVQSGANQIGLTEVLKQVEAIQVAGQWPQAIFLLQNVLLPSPVSRLLPEEQAVLWNRLGYCYFKQEQLPEAQTAFTQGLALSPADLDLLTNLAELHLQQAEYDEATAYINHALVVAPQNVSVLLLLANVSTQLGVYDVALMAFQRVKELASDTPGVSDIIRELSRLEGEPLPADGNEETGAELLELIEQADTAQAAENWLQAIAVLQQAVQIASFTSKADEVTLWNRLGSCHYMAGQLPEAEAAFLKSLEFDPDNVASLNNLADYYTQQEQYDLATGYLNRALTFGPNDVEVLLSLGNCSIQLGAFDIALLAFQKVKQLAPDTASVEDVLAQLTQLEAVS